MPLSLAPLDFLSVEVFHYVPSLPDYMILFTLIFMPTLGYFDQLKKMILTKSSEFFDMDTALILLFTNFLRFIYWAFEPFEPYLLGQAVAVFGVQLWLSITFFYFEYSPHEKVGFGRNRHHMSIKYLLGARRASNVYDFFLSLWFYAFSIVFTFLFCSLLFGRKYMCTVVILIANIVDTTVSIPQFVKIVIEGNIESASTVLVGQYLIGDVMKLLLFLATGSEWPFVFGAVLQTCVDTIVAVSYLIQSRRRPNTEAMDNHDGPSETDPLL